MLFDHLTPHDIAEGAAAASVIGGVFFWITRKLRMLHKRVSDIWLFLAGDEVTESLIDRMVKEEFRSRFMMMHARDGVIEFDSLGHCTYVNPALAKMFDVEASEMLGTGWLIGVRPGDRARLWDSWQESIKNGTPYEAGFELKNGLQVRLVAHACTTAGSRKPLYFIGVVWDANSPVCAANSLQLREVT